MWQATEMQRLGVITSCACVQAKSLQSRPALCSSMDCSLSGSSAHQILQVRTLEWVAMPSFSGPGIEPTSLTSPALARGFFTTSATWETLLLQLNLVLYLLQIVKGLKKPEKQQKRTTKLKKRCFGFWFFTFWGKWDSSTLVRETERVNRNEEPTDDKTVS